MNNNLQIYNKLLKYFSNKTYGGTNHDIPIYGPFNFKPNRKCQHYLTNENANPMIVIPQSSPLSVREFTKPEAVFGLVNICVEDGTKNIDFFQIMKTMRESLFPGFMQKLQKSISQTIFHIWIALLLRFHYTIKSQKHSMI